MGEIKNSEYYDNAYKERANYKCHYKKSEYFSLWTKVIEVLKNIEIEYPFILELGCGTGQFSHYLYDEMFREYVGIDFSSEAIKIAHELKKRKKLFPLCFLKADILQKKTYNLIYNICILLETLEHTDDFKVLKNIEKGNHIIFTVPNFNDPAHVIYFKTAEEVLNRYKDYIDFLKVEQFNHYFIGVGKKR